jgi:hypothetical protein
MQNFYADSKFIDLGLKKCSEKSYRPKTKNIGAKFA